MTDEGKTILLIEDEADLVSVVKFRLKSRGYKVVTASDGIEAIERLSEVTPDLIILDVNLPRMGGIEFYRKICTAHGHPRYPVIILSARADLRKFFDEIEADGFIAKPFEIEDLIRQIERTLRKEGYPAIFLADVKENPHAESIARVLNTERFNVVNVSGFKELKEKIQDVKPAFIVVEYMQDEMPGDEFIRKLKSDRGSKDIPVIVYTYSGFEYEEKSLRAGADKYLGKPKDYDEFIKAIKELQRNNKN